MKMASSLRGKSLGRAALCILIGLAVFLVPRLAEGSRLFPKIGTDTREVEELVKNGELRQEDVGIYESTQRGGWQDRIAAIEQFLSGASVPEELARKLTLQEADLREKTGELAAAKQVLEGWLTAHPDDPEEIELRTWILDILVYKGERLGLTAQERLDQATRIMYPVAERHSVDNLLAIQARLMYARDVRVLGGEIASEWALSASGRQLPVETRELQANKIIYENAVAAERELTSLEATLKGMCGSETTQQPTDVNSPREEDPVRNILAGVVHELKQTAILKKSASDQIEGLTKVTTDAAAQDVWQDLTERTK